MRISDWSSDVCSSDLIERWRPAGPVMIVNRMIADYPGAATAGASLHEWSVAEWAPRVPVWAPRGAPGVSNVAPRSEEHTSELQSLMRISYAVFCLKKKKTTIIGTSK